MSDTTQHTGNNIHVAQMEIDRLKGENAELKDVIEQVVAFGINTYSGNNPHRNSMQNKLVICINKSLNRQAIETWWTGTTDSEMLESCNRVLGIKD